MLSSNVSIFLFDNGQAIYFKDLHKLPGACSPWQAATVVLTPDSLYSERFAVSVPNQSNPTSHIIH